MECKKNTLWMAPAVLSMKAGSHLSLTETAVNPANVMPAAKGGWIKVFWLNHVRCHSRTDYPWDAHIIFVPNMNVFDSYLHVIDYFGYNGLD